MICSKFLLAISLFITFELCPVELRAQSKPRIVIGHASMSSVVLTLWAAQDKGFFAKNNIDAQLVFIPGSPTLVATLNTGDVHFGLTDPVAAADGYEDYVGGVARKPYVGIDGLKNIQRFMKLRNPKIAELNLERLVDESLLRELEKSGFLDQQFGIKSAVK